MHLHVAPANMCRNFKSVHWVSIAKPAIQLDIHDAMIGRHPQACNATVFYTKSPMSRQGCCLPLHRYVPMFGEVDFHPANSYSSVPMEEQMGALSAAVAAGKVRHVGLSNETAWGLTKFCQLGIECSRIQQQCNTNII